MISRSSSLNEIKQLVKNCLNELYERDAFLFQRNLQKGICERCLVFRFAHYLQNKLENYFVDCDFNSSFEVSVDSKGNIRARERNGKQIINEDGTVTKRFIDIIVHERNYPSGDDFVCFEIKKWNNNSKKERQKDYNNLIKLTSDYGYLYGFHIVLGKTKEMAKWCIFRDGRIIRENESVFQNG